MQFLAEMLPLAYFCPHPDADPGSQNLADPTDPDPDPKHCLQILQTDMLKI